MNSPSAVLNIGPHKVTCSSIISPLVDKMLAGETVNVLYSDPPWGDGNLKYWKTLKKRMDGVDAKQITHDQLYDRITDLIKCYVRGHVFIETGLQWQEYVHHQRLAGIGVGNIQTHRIRYKRGSEWADNVLVMGSTNGKRLKLPFEPYAERELETRCVAQVAVRGGILLDPCCGMGFSAQAAVNNLMHFRGNEYNQTRLNKTVALLKDSL